MAGRAFVTGATGFVGGAIVRELIRQGREVVALVRTPEGVRAVAAAGARPVEGDVLNPSTYEARLRGCSTLFHAAGVVGICRRDPTEMLRTNLIGTARVVEAAARAGVGLLVHTSSTAAIGPRPGEVGREDTPHRGWYLTTYERSKAEAERVAFASGRELGLDVVSVNPASVQGPGRADGTARLLLAAARGRLPVAIRTTVSFVDVADCARGHLLAEARGEPGRRYVLCGACLDAGRALDLVAAATGRRRSTLLVPPEVVAPLGAPVAAAWRLLRRDPPFCAEAAAALRAAAFDGSLAERELGLRYTPAGETIRRTIAWFRERGLLAH